MHSAGDLVMCLGEFSGHVGRNIYGCDWVHGGNSIEHIDGCDGVHGGNSIEHIDGCDGVHGGNSIEQRNLEGRMLFEFCVDKELFVSYMI